MYAGTWLYVRDEHAQAQVVQPEGMSLNQVDEPSVIGISHETRESSQVSCETDANE